MILVALVFLYLAIRHGFEPLLLVPIAFGMLLVNIYPDIMADPASTATGVGGLLHYFYILDEWSIFPSLIFPFCLVFMNLTNVTFLTNYPSHSDPYSQWSS